MTVATLEPESLERPASKSRPGALKHGLTATRYISPESQIRILAIRHELTEIHAPESAEERQLVDRLAIAQARLYDAQAAWDERMHWQRSHAAELFDRSLVERFHADLKAWRSSPFAMSIVFGHTSLSATYLRDLWSGVRSSIESDIAVTYDQVKDMIMAFGCDWRADRVDVARGRIMGCYLALQTDPDAAIERWVDDSRAGRTHLADIDDDSNRAHHFLNDAPSLDEARVFLEKLSADEARKWTALAEKMQEAARQERARVIETPPAHPLGDANDVRETRLIRRYLTAAENQADKLERRLLALRKARTTRDSQRTKSNGRSNSDRLGDQNSQSMSVCSTRPDQSAESTQVDSESNDTSQLRNEPSPGSSAVPAAQAVERPLRRPDPKKVAKSWRDQAKKGSPAPKLTSKSGR
jgi:hypothetical protein